MALTLTARSAKLPMMIRQAMVIVTDAKDMRPCEKIPLKPDLIR
jgi:hypothetical protein